LFSFYLFAVWGFADGFKLLALAMCRFSEPVVLEQGTELCEAFGFPRTTWLD
jgi:hypothetical protein